MEQRTVEEVGTDQWAEWGQLWRRRLEQIGGQSVDRAGGDWIRAMTMA